MALVVALNKDISFDSMFEKAIKVFFLLDQVMTPLAQKKIVIKNKSFCILITSLVY